MESVEKLREKIRKDVNNPWSDLKGGLLALVDGVEREIAETEAFCRRVEEAARNSDELDVFGVAYMPLPTDADGVPIRVGDKLIAYNERFDVEGVGDGTVIFRGENDEFGELFNPAATIHYKPRTLEDVLCDLANEVWESSITCQTTWSDSGLDGIEKRYADEIRELLGGDE